MLKQSFMNVIRYWIAVAIFSVSILLLGFGCATKSEKPGAGAQTMVNTPAPPPARPATDVPPQIATTPPVYVPDMSHAGEPLPDGILAWDDLMKATDAAADQAQAHFTFNLTNVSAGNVAIVSVHPSCGCTTAQLPPMPWILAPGANGQINLTVNLAGKSGTLFKTVSVATDKGGKVLTLRINILPRPIPSTMTEADRARGLAAARVDRQAVFKNDCATCHALPGNGKYGQALYDAVCAVCHETEHRATMVPDLHTLKTPTNNQFWQVWIAHGKPGSLMPAFSAADGGPLNDLQIASLAAYLDSAIPSHVAPAGE
jgi:mono/diheme cytochrome c family protein